jgi:hypothetical protein
MAFFGHGKFYTIYQGVRNGDPYWEGFTYFRASTDYGTTWAWSSQLRLPIHQPARACNITGNGDTLFIVAYQPDSSHADLQLWRSYDAGHNWEHLYTPCEGGYHPSGLEYDKAKGVLHVAFLGNDWDIYYARSTDRGDSWEGPILIGFPEDGPSNLPAMESDGRGNVAISWGDGHENPTGTPGIYCRLSHDEGITWQPSARISDSSNAWSDVTVRDGYVGVAFHVGMHRLGYRESFDGGATWDSAQVVALGDFVYGSILRIDETIHLAFREDCVYPQRFPNRAGYVKNDPSTGIWGNGQELLSKSSLSAHPNPFNGQTIISYYLDKESTVSLLVYSITGQLMLALVDKEIQDAGAHKYIWEGRDANGRAVSTGIYFYELYVNETRESKAMIMIK